MAAPVEIACMIYLRAALPLLKEILDVRPDLAKKFEGWNCAIQFEVIGNQELASHILFTDGKLDVIKGRHENPEINFMFKSPEQMKALFSGGLALPKIKGMHKLGKLLKVLLYLLLQLMILQPQKKPKNDEQKKLKVKLLLYLVPYAMRELLKGGDVDAHKETDHMPLRIFEIGVKDGPYSYFLIQEGKLKPGRGHFEQRKPFVEMVFFDYDTAIDVLTLQKDFIVAIQGGGMEIRGPSDYYKRIGNLMMRVNTLVT